MGLEVRVGQHTRAGVKPHNEDACGARVPEEPLLTAKGVAVVVADGMSASEAGREAAETCVQGFLTDYYSTPESWTTRTSAHKTLSALNRWLHGQGQREYGSARGMVTTLSALVLKSTTAYLFHVGDTRIYRLRGGELEQLTRDHRMQVDDDKNYLTRAMGIDLLLDIDHRAEPMEVGDRYLLTTDGVHDHVPAARLRELLAHHGDQPEAAARCIVEAALAAGSDDNLTCQVVCVDALPGDDQQEFYRRLTELPFPPPLDAGMVLDGYRVVRPLFSNKRTEVYLAEDQETGRKVVLKAPSVNYEDDPDYINQFLHEEWAGRRIRSPHVVRVLESTRHRQFLYYITEYVPGQTLRQWMHDHPQPPLATVRDFVEQIARGLRAFHRLEMIHQDLKPENIIVDEHGTLKIIDFGSTKIAGIAEIATPLGEAGPLGTLSYSAPEYVMGGTASNRADIYSLGVITYEMLTGRLPYGRELTPRSMQRARYQPATRFNPEVPRWVDLAIEKAVRLDPARRYEALSEFVHDLSHPNPRFAREQFVPLVERDPVSFWRGLTLALVVLNLVLVYFLLR